ncbi:hypothetical protein EVAR_90186_1 [Eumeta japonica]|uniref:Uncharacterized protein n=1 Tax=Eumeta variegata TaxID=151549 RepID=A0A4C1WYL4_EUMVA|nr:hypothetical protein EVAR_90186_1 [Eumeta japonica]
MPARQLTRIITSPASVSTIIANTSGTSRRGRARRPRGPTQAVLRARVLPNTRAVRRASRRAPERPAYFCDYPQFIEIPHKHHCTKADVAAFSFIKINAGGSAPRPPRTCRARWYGRPRRLPDAEVSDAPRAYHAADGGAPTRTSWEQLL